MKAQTHYLDSDLDYPVFSHVVKPQKANKIGSNGRISPDGETSPQNKRKMTRGPASSLTNSADELGLMAEEEALHTTLRRQRSQDNALSRTRSLQNEEICYNNDANQYLKTSLHRGSMAGPPPKGFKDLLLELSDDDTPWSIASVKRELHDIELGDLDPSDPVCEIIRRRRKELAAKEVVYTKKKHEYYMGSSKVIDEDTAGSLTIITDKRAKKYHNYQKLHVVGALDEIKEDDFREIIEGEMFVDDDEEYESISSGSISIAGESWDELEDEEVHHLMESCVSVESLMSDIIDITKEGDDDDWDNEVKPASPIYITKEFDFEVHKTVVVTEVDHDDPAVLELMKMKSPVVARSSKLAEAPGKSYKSQCTVWLRPDKRPTQSPVGDPKIYSADITCVLSDEGIISEVSPGKDMTIFLDPHDPCYELARCSTTPPPVNDLQYEVVQHHNTPVTPDPDQTIFITYTTQDTLESPTGFNDVSKDSLDVTIEEVSRDDLQWSKDTLDVTIDILDMSKDSLDNSAHPHETSPSHLAPDEATSQSARNMQSPLDSGISTSPYPTALTASQNSINEIPELNDDDDISPRDRVTTVSGSSSEGIGGDVKPFVPYVLSQSLVVERSSEDDDIMVDDDFMNGKGDSPSIKLLAASEPLELMKRKKKKKHGRGLSESETEKEPTPLLHTTDTMSDEEQYPEVSCNPVYNPLKKKKSLKKKSHRAAAVNSSDDEKPALDSKDSDRTRLISDILSESLSEDSDIDVSTGTWIKTNSQSTRQTIPHLLSNISEGSVSDSDLTPRQSLSEPQPKRSLPHLDEKNIPLKHSESVYSLGEICNSVSVSDAEFESGEDLVFGTSENEKPVSANIPVFEAMLEIYDAAIMDRSENLLFLKDLYGKDGVPVPASPSSDSQDMPEFTRNVKEQSPETPEPSTSPSLVLGKDHSKRLELLDESLSEDSGTETSSKWISMKIKRRQQQAPDLTSADVKLTPSDIVEVDAGSPRGKSKKSSISDCYKVQPDYLQRAGILDEDLSEDSETETSSGWMTFRNSKSAVVQSMDKPETNEMATSPIIDVEPELLDIMDDDLSEDSEIETSSALMTSRHSKPYVVQSANKPATNEMATSPIIALDTELLEDVEEPLCETIDLEMTETIDMATSPIGVSPRVSTNILSQLKDKDVTDDISQRKKQNNDQFGGIREAVIKSSIVYEDIEGTTTEDMVFGFVDFPHNGYVPIFEAILEEEEGTRCTSMDQLELFDLDNFGGNAVTQGSSTDLQRASSIDPQRAYSSDVQSVSSMQKMDLFDLDNLEPASSVDGRTSMQQLDLLDLDRMELPSNEFSSQLSLSTTAPISESAERETPTTPEVETKSKKNRKKKRTKRKKRNSGSDGEAFEITEFIGGKDSSAPNVDEVIVMQQGLIDDASEQLSRQLGVELSSSDLVSEDSPQLYQVEDPETEFDHPVRQFDQFEHRIGQPDDHSPVRPTKNKSKKNKKNKKSKKLTAENVRLRRDTEPFVTSPLDGAVHDLLGDSSPEVHIFGNNPEALVDTLYLQDIQDRQASPQIISSLEADKTISSFDTVQERSAPLVDYPSTSSSLVSLDTISPISYPALVSDDAQHGSPDIQDLPFSSLRFSSFKKEDDPAQRDELEIEEGIAEEPIITEDVMERGQYVIKEGANGLEIAIEPSKPSELTQPSIEQEQVPLTKAQREKQKKQQKAKAQSELMAEPEMDLAHEPQLIGLTVDTDDFQEPVFASPTVGSEEVDPTKQNMEDFAGDNGIVTFQFKASPLPESTSDSAPTLHPEIPEGPKVDLTLSENPYDDEGLAVQKKQAPLTKAEKKKLRKQKKSRKPEIEAVIPEMTAENLNQYPKPTADSKVVDPPKQNMEDLAGDSGFLSFQDGDKISPELTADNLPSTIGNVRPEITDDREVDLTLSKNPYDDEDLVVSLGAAKEKHAPLTKAQKKQQRKQKQSSKPESELVSPEMTAADLNEDPIPTIDSEEVDPTKQSMEDLAGDSGFQSFQDCDKISPLPEPTADNLPTTIGNVQPEITEDTDVDLNLSQNPYDDEELVVSLEEVQEKQPPSIIADKKKLRKQNYSSKPKSEVMSPEMIAEDLNEDILTFSTVDSEDVDPTEQMIDLAEDSGFVSFQDNVSPLKVKDSKPDNIKVDLKEQEGVTVTPDTVEDKQAPLTKAQKKKQKKQKQSSKPKSSGERPGMTAEALKDDTMSPPTFDSEEVDPKKQMTDLAGESGFTSFQESPPPLEEVDLNLSKEPDLKVSSESVKEKQAPLTKAQKKKHRKMSNSKQTTLAESGVKSPAMVTGDLREFNNHKESPQSTPDLLEDQHELIEIELVAKDTDITVTQDTVEEKQAPMTKTQKKKQKKLSKQKVLAESGVASPEITTEDTGTTAVDSEQADSTKQQQLETIELDLALSPEPVEDIPESPEAHLTKAQKKRQKKQNVKDRKRKDSNPSQPLLKKDESVPVIDTATPKVNDSENISNLPLDSTTRGDQITNDLSPNGRPRHFPDPPHGNQLTPSPEVYGIDEDGTPIEGRTSEDLVFGDVTFPYHQYIPEFSITIEEEQIVVEDPNEEQELQGTSNLKPDEDSWYTSDPVSSFCSTPESRVSDDLIFDDEIAIVADLTTVYETVYETLVYRDDDDMFEDYPSIERYPGNLDLSAAGLSPLPEEEYGSYIMTTGLTPSPLSEYPGLSPLLEERDSPVITSCIDVPEQKFGFFVSAGFMQDEEGAFDDDDTLSGIPEIDLPPPEMWGEDLLEDEIYVSSGDARDERSKMKYLEEKRYQVAEIQTDEVFFSMDTPSEKIATAAISTQADIEDDSFESAASDFTSASSPAEIRLTSATSSTQADLERPASATMGTQVSRPVSATSSTSTGFEERRTMAIQAKIDPASTSLSTQAEIRPDSATMSTQFTPFSESISTQAEQLSLAETSTETERSLSCSSFTQAELRPLSATISTQADSDPERPPSTTMATQSDQPNSTSTSTQALHSASISTQVNIMLFNFLFFTPLVLITLTCRCF